MLKSAESISKVSFIQIDDKKIPKVLLGTSPLVGAGQFGARAIVYRVKFYEQPRNMVKLMKKSIEFGIPGIQAIGYERIVEAIKETSKQTGVKPIVVATIGMDDFWHELNLIKGLSPEAILLHGSITDSAHIDEIMKYLRTIEKAGAVPGAATHLPGITIPKLERIKKLKIWLVPINKLGLFMEPSKTEALRAIGSTKKVVIGKKILAAGKLKPKEALEYVKDKVDGIAVGIASQKELEQTFRIAIEKF
jgi:hypothetical protein